jgi:signal transduction histidine kinase
MNKRTVVDNFRGDTLLRRLLSLYAVGLLATILGGAALILTAIWPDYQNLEHRDADARLSAVVQALESEQQRLRDLVNTNAVWDEPYAYVEGRNPDFPDVNFSSDALAQIAVDAVVIVRNDGEVLYRGERAGPSALVAEAIRARASAPGLALQQAQDDRTGIVTLADGTFAIVSMRRIVHADGSGPSHGVLLFARRLGPNILAHLESLTGTRFRLTNGSADENARAVGRVTDVYNRALSVEIVGRREILSLGARTVGIVVLAAGLALGSLAIIFAVVMVRTVIAPVSSLERAVARADGTSTAGAVSLRAPLEIRNLAGRFDEAIAAAREEEKQRRLALASKDLAEKDSQAKSQFIAQMSHELRTPLNAIIGYSELMMEDANEAGRADDVSDHKRVLQASRHLLALIDAILDFSKLDAGKMTVSIDAHSSQEVLQEVYDLMAPLAQAKMLTLRLDIGPDIPNVMADRRRLIQCLINFASNAIKFTASGQVTIRVSRLDLSSKSGWIRFEVIDTGIGIEKDALRRVFDPFVQEDNSMTRRVDGAGLGLAITRDLVRLMGGRIGVSSNPGSGSRFVIDLPGASELNVSTAA